MRLIGTFHYIQFAVDLLVSIGMKREGEGEGEKTRYIGLLAKFQCETFFLAISLEEDVHRKACANHLMREIIEPIWMSEIDQS